MAERLAGKRAMITGAAGGIGQAIARRFVETGAKVALTDIRLDAVQTLADALNAERAGAAVALAHDVTSEAQWADVLAQSAQALGGLDTLVNNAGVAPWVPLEAETLEGFKRTQAIDVESVFLGCKLALPYLRQNPPAAIVNVSSIAGLYADGFMTAYNAAKAAVWLMSKSVALYCAKNRDDIRCNSVHPAFIDTPMIDHEALGGPREVVIEKLARNIPLKRVGEPDDVAWACVYLASNEAKFITGAEFKIDGGLSAR